MKQLDLKRERLRRGMKQVELSRASGVDQGTICRLEKGQITNPMFDTVIKLEKALKLRRGSLGFGPTDREAMSA